ncbi:MAG: hypothetical protein QXT99_10005 [Candidatus Nitrosotenuis sp.]
MADLIKGVSYLSVDELPKVPFFLNGVSSRFIRDNMVIPLELKDNVLKVVMANPDDRQTIDALRVATSSDRR